MTALPFDALGSGVQLSPAQRWLFNTGDATRNSVCALLRIQSTVSSERLKTAIDSVVQRHEALRTTFARDTRLRLPLQVIAPQLEARWRTLDIASQSIPEQDAFLQELWDQACHKEWNLARGPLAEATLIYRGGTNSELLLSAAAAVADEWSLECVFSEIVSDLASQPLSKQEPIQYAQFADFHNELIEQGEVLAPKLAPPALLPFEGTPGSERRHAEQHTLVDGRALTPFIQAATRDGVSLESWLLAAWQSHLGLLTSTSEVSVAVRSSARDSEDLQGVIGPVASWHLLALDQQQMHSFAELARASLLSLETARIEGTCLEALSREASLQAARDVIGFRYFETDGKLTPSTWRLRKINCGKSSLRLELALSVTADGLCAALAYDATCFSEAGAATLLCQYIALLRSIASQPSLALKELRLLGEPRPVSHVLSSGASPQLLPLHREFERHAALTPEALALRCGEHTLSYSELNARANRLAHTLNAKGLGAESTVALCCGRTLSAVVGILGTLKAGAAYVPLDPHAPSERLRYQLEQVDFLLTEDALRSVLPSALCPSLSLDEEQLFNETATHNPSVSVPLDALASVVFTSGSTGVPKGVAITHRGIASYTWAIISRLGIEQGWHFATVSTLSADLGNTSIFAALAGGGCLHLISYETATDGSKFWNYAQSYPLDVLKIVPSHLNALLGAAADHPTLPRRLLILGGETLTLELVARLESLGPECAVVNHYGPTETTVGTLALPVREFTDRVGALSVPVGRSLMNGEAYLLDEAMQPAAVGVNADLFLGGSGLARGYLKRPGLTAERFVPHPFAEGERLYRSGDRARYRPDGSIEFLGRRDHQLKIRGFRVELGEIEARLREVPGVTQAVVIVQETGDSKTLAGYVATPSGNVDQNALRDLLQKKLPDYMIPSDIVVLTTLPLTSNGKLDRAALPAPGTARIPRQHIAPRTRTERIVAEIWAELLKRPSVSIEDNFFALGGHSLLAIPMMHRVQSALGRSTSLTAIFEAPTVAGLAGRLDAQETTGVQTLRAGDNRPPLFCFDPTGQHLAHYQGLADTMPDGQPVFGVQFNPAELGAAQFNPTQHSERLSMDGIIAGLAAKIQGAYPDGPYRLLGWSLGGVLALGVARAIESQGGTVEFLSVVDTTPRAELYAAGEPDIVDELAAYVDANSRQALRAVQAAALDELRARLVAVESNARSTFAITWAQEHGLLDREAPLEGLAARYALLRSAALFIRDFPRATLRTPLHVFWSSETIERDGNNPWDFARYTLGPTTIERLHGDHFAAVLSPESHTKVRAALARLTTC